MQPPRAELVQKVVSSRAGPRAANALSGSGAARTLPAQRGTAAGSPGSHEPLGGSHGEMLLLKTAG